MPHSTAKRVHLYIIITTSAFDALSALDTGYLSALALRNNTHGALHISALIQGLLSAPKHKTHTSCVTMVAICHVPLLHGAKPAASAYVHLDDDVSSM